MRVLTLRRMLAWHSVVIFDKPTVIARKCCRQPLSSLRAIAGRKNIHIDGREGTVSDGAADSTSKGESRVQSGTGGRGWVDAGSNLGLDGVELGGAGGGGRGSSRHVAGVDGGQAKKVEWRVGCGVEDGMDSRRFSKPKPSLLVRSFVLGVLDPFFSDRNPDTRPARHRLSIHVTGAFCMRHSGLR